MTIKVGVLGAGSWGTTLALVLHENGHEVGLWEYDEKVCHDIRVNLENKHYLPGIKIPQGIFISNDLSDIITGSSVLVMAIPSHAMRKVSESLSALKVENRILVSVAKGIENVTLLRMSEVIAQTMRLKQTGSRVCVLSGPSHAEEVSRKMPTSIVAAADCAETAQQVQGLFINDYFRVYTNSDVIGVELGGSLKNVIALAAGIVDGLGYGDNTKAALLTRGMAEISRLGAALGAKQETFSGLSGIGDLIVTCTSRHSRNRGLGEMLGQGLKLDEALSKMTMVAEGVRTTTSAYELAKKVGIELPITEAVYRTLFEGYNPRDALRELMTREAKPEMASFQ